MSYRVVYDSEAGFEFRQAVAWYEGQSEGLGVRFTLEVDKTVAGIAAEPLRFSEAGRIARKARVLGWPYTVYFVINETHAEIKIVAVWHGARNPHKLKRRLN